ncbi:MAG: sugar transferase [Clostridia bacterium]|nr:sugar transferase [Clostridia bacterium]
MNDFLNSWPGIATIVAFDVFALLIIISLTYRWFFKRIFDVLCSGVCLILTSPLFLAVLIRGKIFMNKNQGAIEGLTQTYYKVGKNERVLALKKFRSRDSEGQVLGAYGRWIESWKLSYLPRIFEVFLGKISIIGVKELLRSEAEFVETDVEKDRFLVRPGLINPLVRMGDEQTTYEEMFLSDRKYAWQFAFFMDIKIFFSWLLKKIRGEDNSYMGETRKESYAENLLKEERITKEDFEAALELDEKFD